MSTPENIAIQIEPAIKEAISGAALVFSQQAAPSGSSCALQTKFLENLVARFRKQDGDQPNRPFVQTEHGRQSRPEANSEVSWNPIPENFAAPERTMDQIQETPTFEFAEEAAWASLIAEAGFCAQDGNFFPSDYRI